MKASEVVKAIQAIIAVQGDIQVVGFNPSGDFFWEVKHGNIQVKRVMAFDLDGYYKNDTNAIVID